MAKLIKPAFAAMFANLSWTGALSSPDNFAGRVEKLELLVLADAAAAMVVSVVLEVRQVRLNRVKVS